MTRKLQITAIFVLFFLLALANMAMTPSAQDLLTPTVTLVKIKPQVTVTRVIKPRSTVTRAIIKPTFTASPFVREPSKTKAASASLAMQAGNSDWIVVIGIFIVMIIVIPLLLKYKEWRSN